MALEILFVGEDKPGSRAPQRVAALRDLGHAVTFVRAHPKDETYETPPSLAKRIRHRVRRPADTARVGRALMHMTQQRTPPDIVWIDYVLTIRPGVFGAIRAAWPRSRLVWYSEDDMMQPHNGSVWLDRSVPYFDLWVTTKSFNARSEEMPARGARRVLFVHNTYDRNTHRPVDLTEDDRKRFGGEASFVGTYEAARAASLSALAAEGIAVRVWGNGWHRHARPHANLRIEGRPVYGDDLVRVYAGTDINLGFLRKLNRDLQTCRTIEIPACGGFLLHERNSEVCSILAEGREAAYFSDDAELAAQCRSWLDRPRERAAVAAAGHTRITSGPFSHHDRVAEILDAALAGS